MQSKYRELLRGGRQKNLDYVYNQDTGARMQLLRKGVRASRLRLYDSSG